MLKLGTIRGRHAMPVSTYILNGDVLPGQDAYDVAYTAACMCAPLAQHGVALYYTGLTEVTLGCIDGLASSGYGDRITLMRYDSVSGDYVPLRRVVACAGPMDEYVLIHQQELD